MFSMRPIRLFCRYRMRSRLQTDPSISIRSRWSWCREISCRSDSSPSWCSDFFLISSCVIRGICRIKGGTSY